MKYKKTNKAVLRQQDQNPLRAQRPSKPNNSNRQALLNRQVFDKNAFNNTVNTDFTELVSSQDPQFFDVNLATQEDFFLLYDKFFYEIPKLGEVNSHLYLVQTSGEYIDYSPNAAEIQALLEEIAELRRENLELRQEFANAIVDVFGVETPEAPTLEEVTETAEVAQAEDPDRGGGVAFNGGNQGSGGGGNTGNSTSFGGDDFGGDGGFGGPTTPGGATGGGGGRNVIQQNYNF